MSLMMTEQMPISDICKNLNAKTPRDKASQTCPCKLFCVKDSKYIVHFVYIKNPILWHLKQYFTVRKKTV